MGVGKKNFENNFSEGLLCSGKWCIFVHEHKNTIIMIWLREISISDLESLRRKHVSYLNNPCICNFVDDSKEMIELIDMEIDRRKNAYL